MEKIVRADTPDYLKDNWKKWGKKWADRYAANNKASFNWPRHKKKKTWDLLIELLSGMTQSHCSFCDSYPVGSRLEATIEHFKPKSKVPFEAYKWENLFLCCRLCQRKGDTFDERLLKPDEDNYSFDKYFDIDAVTGKLIPNRDAAEGEQERARITIKLFQLNDNGKPDDRLREMKHFQDMSDPEIDEFAYRFLIKRCL